MSDRRHEDIGIGLRTGERRSETWHILENLEGIHDGSVTVALHRGHRIVCTVKQLRAALAAPPAGDVPTIAGEYDPNSIAVDIDKAGYVRPADDVETAAHNKEKTMHRIYDVVLESRIVGEEEEWCPNAVGESVHSTSGDLQSAIDKAISRQDTHSKEEIDGEVVEYDIEYRATSIKLVAEAP